MKNIHFFALNDDILPVLEAVERKGLLKYTRCGVFSVDGIQTFNAGAEIPRLGIASSESAINCETYLVCERDLQIQVEPIQVHGIGERLAVDQRFNEDTITFSAGGIWTEDILLNGRVATVSDSQTAQALMRRFHSAIKKAFVKIRAFHVGPNAFAMLNAGKRLTIAEQSPREFDLSRP